MYKKIIKIASIFGLLLAEPTLAGNFLPTTTQQPQQIQSVTTTSTENSSQFTQINSTNITNSTTITYVNNVPVNIVLDGTLYTTSTTTSSQQTHYQETEEIQGSSSWDNTQTNEGSCCGGGLGGYAVAFGEDGEVVFIQNEDDQTQEFSGAGVNNVEVVNEETFIQMLEGLIIDAQVQENNIDVYNVENNVENIQNINSGNNITVVVIGTQNNIGQQVINPPPPVHEEEEEVEVETEEKNDDTTDTSDTSDNSDSDSDKECEEKGGHGLKCGLKDAKDDIKDAVHDVKDGIKDAVKDTFGKITSLFHHD